MVKHGCVEPIFGDGFMLIQTHIPLSSGTAVPTLGDVGDHLCPENQQSCGGLQAPELTTPLLTNPEFISQEGVMPGA